MKIPIILAAVFAPSFPALSQDEKPLPVARILLRADALQVFAPRGWRIEKTICGDLNRDKIPDCALVLVEKSAKPYPDSPYNSAPRPRALVVLLREGKGYRRAGFNASLLLGTRDGGAFYGVTSTPVNISIKNGVLAIEQEFGSREVTEIAHKFRYDARAKRFYLIGLEESEYDRANGNSKTISTNYLTGVQMSRTMTGKRGLGTRQTKRVSRNLRSLESVKGDERYSG